MRYHVWLCRIGPGCQSWDAWIEAPSRRAAISRARRIYGETPRDRFLDVSICCGNCQQCAEEREYRAYQRRARRAERTRAVAPAASEPIPAPAAATQRVSRWYHRA